MNFSMFEAGCISRLIRCCLVFIVVNIIDAHTDMNSTAMKDKDAASACALSVEYSGLYVSPLVLNMSMAKKHRIPNMMDSVMRSVTFQFDTKSHLMVSSRRFRFIFLIFFCFFLLFVFCLGLSCNGQTRLSRFTH